MSNMALSSARRRRTGPPVNQSQVQAQAQPQLQQQTQLQQAQMQRLMEIQKQRQQQQQPQQPQPQSQFPYTQRPFSAPPVQPQLSPFQSVQPQSPLSHSRPIQIVKADTVVPPGYVKILSPNGVYHMESVETGSINFPYAEPHLAPTIILRNHDLDIIKLQGQHNDMSNQLTHLTTIMNRTSASASASASASTSNVSSTGTNFSTNDISNTTTNSSALLSDQAMAMEMEEHEIIFDEAVINKITENPGFISNTVNHIMQNTNLSDMLSQVEIIKTENRELRSILNSQHEMMNAMNSLLFTLLNKMHMQTSSESSTETENCESMPHLAGQNSDSDFHSSLDTIAETNDENVDELVGPEPDTTESAETTKASVSTTLTETLDSVESVNVDVARDWLP
jgi:hypothetical protein